ncbi:hypothetical protein QBC39DRAFT_23628 [Podospora conica]|nr:hypothetical protein QBC39DRAFT_23628 [Schizothecium conicum]
MPSIWPSRIILRGALSIAGLSAVTFYIVRRKLETACRRVPIATLPKSSACRNFVEQASSATTSNSLTAWGLGQTRLLPSWPPGNDDDDDSMTHWIPSFVVVQMELPADSDAHDDMLPLAKKLLACFLDARAAGPEPWVLDRGVPPLKFAPGHPLFGTTPEPGAFLLGTWSTMSGESVDPLALPDSAPRPVAAFPSNRDVVKQRCDEVPAAGSVLYWRAGQIGVRGLSRTAGLARLWWRFPEGGFQELIVERVADDKLRVSYVSAEVGPCRQAEGVAELGRLAGFLYEVHVMYAQCLLSGAARRLRAT